MSKPTLTLSGLNYALAKLPEPESVVGEHYKVAMASHIDPFSPPSLTTNHFIFTFQLEKVIDGKGNTSKCWKYCGPIVAHNDHRLMVIENNITKSQAKRMLSPEDYQKVMEEQDQ